MSEKTPGGTRKPPASAWRPGESGNPKGRPKGARNKTTLAVESLMQGQAEAVAQKAVALALEGDTAMIRAVLDRVSPVPKDKPVTLDMPSMENATDCPKAVASILAACAAGELTPTEAAAVAGLVELQRRALETSELEQRIAALEKTKGA